MKELVYKVLWILFQTFILSLILGFSVAIAITSKSFWAGVTTCTIGLFWYRVLGEI